MRRNCSSCGAAVSARYHRVKADRSGDVECPACQPKEKSSTVRGVPPTWGGVA